LGERVLILGEGCIEGSLVVDELLFGGWEVDLFVLIEGEGDECGLEGELRGDGRGDEVGVF
jgi:hypothetical protein